MRTLSGKSWFCLASCLLLQALGSPMARAQVPNTLDFGFEARVRSEAWNNIADHSDQVNDGHLHYRFRTRLWAQYNLGSKLELAAGLANENRKVVRPDAAYNGRQTFVETLSINWRFAPGWALKAGRQDLMRGEGFIFMDGSALDGSRSSYMNAIDLSRTLGKASKIEFIALSDPRQDKWLPRLNDPSDLNLVPRLNEWDERALALYYTGREAPATSLDAYVVLKTETGDYRAPASPAFQPDRHLTTVGARVDQLLGNGWSANAELAFQFGQQAANGAQHLAAKTIAAQAGYARLKKAIDGPWKPKFSVGFIGLSGTDPKADKIGGWDPVFSRWPKWSELYVYSQPAEKGVAYWTNTGMFEAEARVSPAKFLDLRATYYRMAAFVAPTAATATFGTGKHRGDIYQVRADIKMSDAFKGHVLYEHLAPGSFYAQRDPGYFLRMELSFLFKGRI